MQWSFSGGNGQYYQPSTTSSQSTTELVLTRNTQKTGTTQTYTITATGLYGGWSGQNKTASATVTIPATQVDLTALHAGAAINLGVGSSESINGHYTYEPDYDAAGAPYLKFKYTSNSESVATVDASGKVTAVGPGSTTITVTAVKLDGTDGVTCNVTVNVTIDAPTISIDGSGNVTITHPVPGVQIRYTTNGVDPTATTGTVYTASFAAGNEQTIKAIAVANGVASAVASQFYATSGVSGTKVVINDYEDHNWTYYAGVDSEVDGGLYNTNYLGKLYSPNPRNVKITYNATNNAAVSIDESATSFVYYKTLEEGATTGQYPYQVISNPFSKRPAHSGTTYYGFAGWKIVSGGEYINGYNNGATLPLDAEITFVNLPYQSKNCTSAEIVFETTWTTANRTYITTNPGSGQTYTFNSGTYETNFVVIDVNYTRQITIDGSATIMMVEPDGSANYRGRAFSGALVPAADAANTTKIEFANWTNTGDINAQGRNLTIGRGVTHSEGTLYGTNTDANINQVFKIESGSYQNFYAIGSNGPTNNMTKQHITFGNDYDRANNNDNSKMRITNGMYLLGKGANTGMDKLIITAKSGSFTPSLTHTTASASGNCFYLSYNSGTQQTNHRTLIIEGGEFWHIAGGYDRTATNDVNLKIRVKGGIIHGCVYGGAAKYRAQGSKQFVFTGGTVEGWIAGGSNGFGATANTATTNTSTSSVSGDVQGQSYIYVGGNTIVKSNNETKIDESVGGNVFGAGCGNTSIESSGRVNRGTNVVIADNAEVQRGVYGGGAYGSTPATANLYVTGGLVSCIYDTQNNAFGGVYGGARQKSGADVNIYMTDGTIEGVTRNGNTGGGLYGGSNNDGTLSGSVKMQINGGYVGTESHVANIHGGGYGQTTGVSGNVDITLGKTGAARDADGVTVWGDVYGGSALGSVNGTAAADTYHTNVTMNAGYIHGSLYGGALGNAGTAANVYGPVQVKVCGGSVMNTDGTGANGSGAVYGANNINGAPQRSVTVDIYGTNSAPAEGEYALFSVYGGGNAADYSHTYAQNNGYPKVTVHNCDNSIEYVYGGGNAAAVAATDVTIYGGDKIGNVFGGGNGQVTAANVTGGTNVKIYGGTIGDVYGGSNTNGTIGGTINVNVNAQKEDGAENACPIDIDNVYGGGNKADSKAGNVTIGCAEHIGAVYGGANQANITSGNIDLSIVSGHIDNVFGGNNTSGNISGTITVTVNDNNSACGMEVGNVYGGGNQAAYTAPATNGSKYPAVNIQNGHLTGSVFGGGLGETAVVTGNPQVTIGQPSDGTVHIDGNVFGGGDAANVVGKPVVLVQNCSTMIGTKTDGVWNATGGTVYGGGNAAHVTGAGNGTSVTINGGDINRVFGGGNGEVSPANVEGNAVTVIHAGNIHQAFAGSNMQGNISGSATITVDHNNAGCGELIDEVYGGGNQAAGNAGTVTIDCGANIGDVYGGANQADINSPITLNITGGTINRVFGGNNTSGNISGAITVNVNKKDACDLDLNYVYGAGNQASYTPSTPGAYPAVNILKGTVTHDVFGGGLGATAIVTSNPTVTINGGTVSGNVFGGGSAANVVGNTSIYMTEGTVSNIYGGGEAADVVVGAAETGKTVVNMNGGTVSHSVYGGGLGNTTNVATSTTVTANGGIVTEDVYGGSGFGKVGATTVTINNGATVTRDVFGGGFGQNADAGAGKEAYEADVTGNASVTIYKGAVISGNVYGGNNTNGSPKGTITVLVDGPVDAGEKAATPLNLKDVFGGGKNAATTSTGAPQVTIQGCETVIARVFGGGDAAPAPATNVTIWGGHITSAFAGGNGEVTAADIVGNVNITIKGGAITNVFGGSNTAGNIGGAVNVIVDKDPAACDLDVTNLFGGGNLAPGKGGTLTIACTGDGKIDNVYGGANQADVEGDVTLVINGGNIGNAFGGNNQSGAINGAITVVVEWDGDCDENNLDYVYGGGNLAPYTTPDGKVGPTVQLINATINNNVYGGGLGAAARITGNPVVTLEGATVTGNIFGGGDAAPVEGNPTVTATEGAAAKIFAGGKGATAVVTGNPTAILNKADDKTLTVTEIYGGGDAAEVTGNTTVTLTKGAVTNAFGGGNAAAINGNTTVSIADATASNVYGGGNLAGVTQTATINMTGGNVTTGLYGGCNSEGTVTGDIAVNVTGGQVGTDAEHKANVHGGGYGSATQTAGNVAVAVNGAGVVVFGDIYGGSALGNVNDNTDDNTDDNTTVTITAGTVNGDVYGGGLGDASNAALVNGNVAVNINGGTVTGNVFGCNNVNGTPKGSVAVTVAADANAHIAEVYGGGNMATYSPTTAQAPVVTILGCGNTIGYVYGGGNAADVPATNVTIWGGTIGNVFGGGHGDKDANPATEANVTGNVTVNIKGGTITNVFAGSNSKGNIGGTVDLTIDKDGDCPMHITDVYGGGNQAAGNAGTVTIGCTGGADEGIQNVYGGANAADINSNIALVITGGTINNVFGGNNSSGNISGTIDVTIDWNGSCTTNHINNVYGAGNQAAYTGSPAVKIYNGTISQNVFGGGLGATAVVTGDPVVTIGDATAPAKVATVGGDVYGGGDAAAVVGTTQVNVIAKDNTTIQNVYGGGNAANVNGTDVNIDGGNITGMVFGGGHGNAGASIAANVNGNVSVDVTGGTINKVFGGSNDKGNITGTVAVNINKGNDSNPMHITEVYGGGNVAAGNAGTVTIGCTGGADEGIGTVYGGANNADVGNDIVLNISGGRINNVFGGNNNGGSISGTISVIVDWDGTCDHNYLENVYGAGNLAQYSAPAGNDNYPRVVIRNATIEQNVYGAGKGDATRPSDNLGQVTGNPQVFVGTETCGTAGHDNSAHTVMVKGSIYGGGNAAPVTGNPYVETNGKTNHGVVISNYVFGGGLGATAKITGSTEVKILGNTNVGKNVYGGGHGGDVTGNTHVVIGE